MLLKSLFFLSSPGLNTSPVSSIMLFHSFVGKLSPTDVHLAHVQYAAAFTVVSHVIPVGCQ